MVKDTGPGNHQLRLNTMYADEVRAHISVCVPAQAHSGAE